MKLGRWPGDVADDLVKQDTAVVWEEMQRIASFVQAPDSACKLAHAEEVTRFGGAELHNIAALMGGVASQEAVKVITHQFQPLNSTMIFNGISGCASTFRI